MAVPRLDDLATLEAEIWRELQAAVNDKAHGWRIGVLATHDGAAADARSVVLREASAAARELAFFTDSRSAKVRQIAVRPHGMLVLWSAGLSWQLRLEVELAVATSGLAVSSHWARLKMTPDAQDYLSPLPPGSRIERPRPDRGSRAHFAVVTARVGTIDWLELHADGHRRAVFDAAGARWVVP